ncbi:MAG: zf-HC2 domain-containing protein [Candidatus Scatovivens sp.]
MKEKRDCKIVQDLLPNYIEKLTNDETNKYIEEHLNECEECKKIYENMQKDLKLNFSKRDSREVKYIKKFNKKFKLLRNVLIIIMVLFVIIVGRKTFILMKLSNKANNMINQTNYYTKTETYSNGQMNILESYNKDGITYGTMNLYSEGNDNRSIILYKSEKERIILIDDGTTKTLNNKGDVTINPVYFTGENILENLFIAITTSIDKIELNGKKCYLIRDGNTEKFIDVNTGLAIKMIDNQNNRTTDYKYEFDVVKDTDIIKPDTTGYTINE